MRALWIAFSMYSRVPVPHTEWSEDGMRYSMCCFPLVGALLGLLQYGLFLLAEFKGIPGWSRGVLMTALVVLYTGGIHLDGFMDTQDAKHSWGNAEERRKILKDPHVGAFAVTACVVYLMVCAAVLGIADGKAVKLIAVGYVLSRCLSGISVVTFRKASKEGTVRMFADAAEKRVFAVLLAETVCAAALLVYLGGVTAIVMTAAAGAVFLYYRLFAYKYFDGINGDLAGYFLCLCELATAGMAVLI